MALAPAALTPLGPAPLVTVVMAVRDEAAFIETAIESVKLQTYPTRRIEIVLADGGSKDDTVALASRTAGNVRFTVLSNTKQSYAAGLNVAIRASSGDVIVKLDGHAAFEPTYIEVALRMLRETNAAVVGSRLRTRGRTAAGRAIAYALSHPLVVGGAEFRLSGPTMMADSVPFGAYRREVFDLVGLFREDVGRAEDLELHSRIRAVGGVLLLIGASLVTYWSRETFGGLAKQYFASGRDMARHPRGMRVYQLAPALALGAFVALIGLLRIGVPAATVVAAALCYSVIPTTVLLGARSAGSPALLAGLAVIVVHASHALGFWFGLLSSAQRLRRGS